jgi:hypothetical protein
MGIFSRKNKDDHAPAPAAPTPATTGPTPTDPPGALVTNHLVQNALTKWVERKDAQSMYGVLRECAAGSLLLDATESTFADPANPFQKGDTLAIGSQVDNAGKRLLVAFTDNDRLAVYRRNGGSTKTPLSFGQSAASTLQMAATTYEGIAIDPGSPDTTCIAYTDEIRKGLTDDAAVNEPLKTAIVDQRAPAEVIDLAKAAPVIFIGVSTEKDAQGEVVSISVPGILSPDGESYSTAFTSPAEVWAWDARLDVRPTGFANIVAVARENGHTAVVVNPAGRSPVIPLEAIP